MAPPTHLGGQDQTTLPMHQPSPSAHQMKQNIETISILVQARPGTPPHIPASARTSPHLPTSHPSKPSEFAWPLFPCNTHPPPGPGHWPQTEKTWHLTSISQNIPKPYCIDASSMFRISEVSVSLPPRWCSWPWSQFPAACLANT